MFEESTYPCAVTDGDGEGLEVGFRWCADRMRDCDGLTLFVPLKSSLQHSGRRSPTTTWWTTRC